MQRPRLPRPSLTRGALVGIVAAMLLAFPLGVLAAHQFDDVPNGYLFHNDIDALVDAGVTSGCDDNSYCPNQFVTRGQMAAFLNRLGALQAGKPRVANAATSLSTDGFSLGCPSGTVWSGGVCLETTPRAATTYFSAVDVCAGLQGLLGSGWRYRLPTVAELMGARNVSGINLNASGDWADAIHGDAGSYWSITVTEGPVIAQETTIANNAYRCVTPPVALDLNLIFIPLDEQARYPEAPQSVPGGPQTDNGSPGN